jgi:nitrite reductase/ring-hydroxylating ferredoxin subunit
MALVKIGSIDQLPPGSVMEAEVSGNPYAICNVEGELHALDGVCPHAGGPLGQGALHGSTLVCPWHGWEYDCRTGVNDFDEDVKVPRFPVRVEAGEIWIDVPE